MQNDNDQLNGTEADDLLPEYDFVSMAGGVRGKYAERAKAGSNVVLIDPDVASVFPDAESVNFALRHMAAVLKHERHEEAG